MRAVPDTNILISACLKPAGNEARVLRLPVEFCITETTLAEYREVFTRKKFDNIRGAAEELLQRAACWTLVEAARTLDIAIDPDDNRFLECAEAAQADYLITGNIRHYPAEWGLTRVVNARALLLLHESE